MSQNTFDKINYQQCNARDCWKVGRGRFCPHHRSLYRFYGAPIKGPQKPLLKLHERYLKKTLGPICNTDPTLSQVLGEISCIAFDPRPIHFQDHRGNTRWAVYQSVSEQVFRIKQGYPKDSQEELAERLWWAFLTVMYVEQSEVFVHQDRHHFWTSVLRLLLKDSHRQKPSARYVDHLHQQLNKRLSNIATHWLAQVD
ncbi:hypothetical protein C0081_11435 [Cohaesibacter celericrescens]|uniref:Uncharacterized protein n=1 Tax=Cohaesibacter celericrescens TaxID=2067669 RepID=A0A2N5XQF7_9HYPH|nr:hypothetical protein C0081_11435 [Cohaesibacter celericrescens]